MFEAHPHAYRRLVAVLLASLLAVSTFVLLPRTLLAQTETADMATADDEFSRQLRDLKKSFGEVARQIEDGAQIIDRTQDPEQGRKSIQELRNHVGRLLGAVADNGEVSKLGAKALSRADEKLRTLEQETRFKPDEKQFLIDKWRELRASTEAANRELDRARRDFAELLRTLQTNEDYIDELLQIREHEKALVVIHQLTDGIRDASTKLQKLLGAIKPPGA
jgi:DNA repair exonuclease SbcCD ATPase subunit